MSTESIGQLINQLATKSTPPDPDVVAKLQQIYQNLGRISDPDQPTILDRIVQSNIPSLLNASCRQALPGSWNSVSDLNCLLVQLCQFLIRNKQFSLTKQDLIRELVESYLIQLRHVQKQYLIMNRSAMSKQEQQQDQSKLFATIGEMVQNFGPIIQESDVWTQDLINSPWFVQLFVTDDEQMTELFIGFLTTCMKKWPASFGRLNYNQKVDLLDELMYQLAILSRAESVICTLGCLVTITETTPDLRLLLLKRYHGIQLLLSRWATQFLTRFKQSNLAPDQQVKIKQMISQLIDFVGPYRSKSSKDLADDQDLVVEKRQQHVMTENQAAVVIQSQWRGYLDRSRLKRISQAFALFQRKFREKQSIQKKMAREQRMEAEFDHFVRTNRHQRRRERLEAEARLWASLPASLFKKELNNQRQEAAICIQKFYRGFKVRSWFNRTRKDQLRHRAAWVIQNAFRKFLSRKECLSTMKPQVELKGNDDGANGQIDIIEARKKHRAWCETQMKSSKFMDECPNAKLHNDIQIKLHQYYLGEMARQSEAQTREASLVRCQMNSELLLSELNEQTTRQQSAKSTNPNTSPRSSRTSLSQIIDQYENGQSSEGKSKFDKFFCRLQPLARLAQEEHRECLLNLEKPWWESTMRQYRKNLNKWCQAHELKVTTDTNKPCLEQEAEDRNEALNWLPDKLLSELDYVDEFLYTNNMCK